MLGCLVPGSRVTWYTLLSWGCQPFSHSEVKRKWLCTYVQSRNPILAQASLAWLIGVVHRKYKDEAAGLQSQGAGNLISPAPGVPKSLFSNFCFSSSKLPRGRTAHKHLNSLYGGKKDYWMDNIKDESAVSLLTSVKKRVIEATPCILDRC